jgi:predicted PurR-regulated permease PerM
MSTPQLPRLPAGERLRRAGVAAWSIIGILIVGAIFVWALFRVRIIFPPLVVALLTIYLLNPIVDRLEQRRVSRGWGTLLAYVVVVGAITLVVVAVTPLISRQVDTFRDQWPQFKIELAESIVTTGENINDRFGVDLDTARVTCLLDADDTGDANAPSHERCDAVTQRFRETLADSADRITEVGSSVLEVLFIFILGPLLALYLLIDLPHLQRDLVNLVPEAHREEMADLGSKVGKTVGGFFRGQFLVALTVGVMASIGFAIIDLPFWLVIGAIAGFTNLIPLVGPFIGGGLGFLVGSITGGLGLGLQAALVALIVQQIDNHVISPNVMKRTVQLHPVAVMLSILAGGALAGFWGVLLGVPAVAVAKLLLSHLWATRVLGIEATPYATTAAVVPPSVVPEEGASDRPDDTASS